ncbi:protein ELF4-LIKE 2-like [Phalaenopsis equestris]|uniref:protein ELF4-LIKE 2-like n=1 Tax=Phalaenopsis equestris TaxID=78828 RepID=UPI0009E42781|nr:protein ELF4-LIKE 2-like [Phalaenopsis equestris]
MEEETFSGLGNRTLLFHKSFVQVQGILDQNSILINEINQNHDSMIPDSLSKNVSLIRELNNNVRFRNTFLSGFDQRRKKERIAAFRSFFSIEAGENFEIFKLFLCQKTDL